MPPHTRPRHMGPHGPHLEGPRHGPHCEPTHLEIMDRLDRIEEVLRRLEEKF